MWDFPQNEMPITELRGVIFLWRGVIIALVSVFIWVVKIFSKI